jgi:prephenate dehydrogenase
MSIQITLLGLERLGASAGLALGRPSVQFERTGYDNKPATENQAMRIKAVDRLAKDLPQSVRKADVIFLSMPMHHVRETLQAIAQELREDVVILDTSPAKASVAAWVRELLPTRCHYVGLSLKVNPKYALDQDETIAAASADLFEHGEMAIAAPLGTPSQAISLAADLAGVLGARPFFCDLAEMDGLTASTRLLPQLVSTALLNATLGQPGWRDALKFTGAEYAAASSGIAGREESASLREAALLNRENLLRSLDAAMSALQALRADIENDRADSLDKKLEAARLGRLEWLKEFSRPGGQENGPTAGEMPKKEDYLKQQFGFLSKRPAPPKPGEKQD